MFIMFKRTFTTGSLRLDPIHLGFSHTFLRLQGCVQRGDELVSENLHLRTESAEVEEAEDRVTGGASASCGGLGGWWWVLVFGTDEGRSWTPNICSIFLGGGNLEIMENRRRNDIHIQLVFEVEQVNCNMVKNGTWMDMAISHICDGSFRFGSQLSSFVQKSL